VLRAGAAEFVAGGRAYYILAAAQAVFSCVVWGVPFSY